MFMPQSSGQRQGLVRNMPEIAHSVSPRLTVYSSGALGASSDNGTPACATCSAVERCPGVIGKFCAKAAGAARTTGQGGQQGPSAQRRAGWTGRPAGSEGLIRFLQCLCIAGLDRPAAGAVESLDKVLAILRSSP